MLAIARVSDSVLLVFRDWFAHGASNPCRQTINALAACSATSGETKENHVSRGTIEIGNRALQNTKQSIVLPSGTCEVTKCQRNADYGQELQQEQYRVGTCFGTKLLSTM
jgi:hypothetical protein